MLHRFGGLAAGATVLIALSVFVVGCDFSTAPPPLPKDTGLSAAELFKANCSICHGIDLQGGTGPVLQHIGQTLPESAIAAQIQNGGGGMPSFAYRIGPHDIKTLAAWLAAKK